MLTRNKQRSSHLYDVVSEPDFFFGSSSIIGRHMPSGSLAGSRVSILEYGRFYQVRPIVTNS